MARRDRGECERCKLVFAYELLHSGFGDFKYAYCDTCGMTATFDSWNTWVSRISALTKGIGEIEPSAEPFLLPCQCGGHFQSGSLPRCPICKMPISADFAAGYLERNALGSMKGWRWQRNWSGAYCIVIEDPNSMGVLRIRKDPVQKMR